MVIIVQFPHSHRNERLASATARRAQRAGRSGGAGRLCLPYLSTTTRALSPLSRRLHREWTGCGREKSQERAGDSSARCLLIPRSAQLQQTPLAPMLPSRVTSALHASLLSLGVSVHPAWVGPALQAEMATGELSALKSFVDGDNDAAAPMPPSLLAAARDALLARVLFSSLEQIGTRRLPIVAAGVAPEPRSMLRGLHVLQLVECVDVAHSLTELQEQPHRSDRSWKMQLTDGTGCVAAFERKRCSNLTPQVMQPGVKVRTRTEQLASRITGQCVCGSCCSSLADLFSSSRFCVCLLCFPPARSARRPSTPRHPDARTRPH